MITVLHGDSRVELRALADNSLDACACDPPYALDSIVKRFGGKKAAPAKAGKTGAYARASAGFMGQKWDTGDTAFDPEFWREVYRVLKPGAFVVAFGGTRTYHRLACAIEDAGFEIRDMVSWLYGSGFPKSHNLPPLSVIATRQTYEGRGSAFKPAFEPCVLARKPLDGTILENVLTWGTGTLYIDGCRIEVDDDSYARNASGDRGHADNRGRDMAFGMGSGRASEIGRWPANVVHDGSDQVLAAFPDSDGQQFSVGPEHAPREATGIYGDFGPRPLMEPRGDVGSAARFFYTAKADAIDRLGTLHPTVKPVALMAWLVRLVTPPGGCVLDPFAGSGSTGVAALFEGFDCVLIEREAKFVADINRRLAWARGEGRLTASEKKQPKAKPAHGIDRELFE